MGGPIRLKLGGRVRGAFPCVFHRVGVVGGAVCHAHEAKTAETRVLGAIWGRLEVDLGTSGTKLGRGGSPCPSTPPMLARPRPLLRKDMFWALYGYKWAERETVLFRSMAIPVPILK